MYASEERLLSGDANASFVNVPGRPFTMSSDMVLVNHVGDAFFETLGIGLFAGRTFAPVDMGKDSDAVIVDDVFVHRFYGNRNPLGQQLGLGAKPVNQYRIVGVLRKSRYNSLRKASLPAMFFPSAASRPGWRVNFALRTTLSTGQLSSVSGELLKQPGPEFL